MNITNSLCSTDYDPSQQEFSLNQQQLNFLLFNEERERSLRWVCEKNTENFHSIMMLYMLQIRKPIYWY